MNTVSRFAFIAFALALISACSTPKVIDATKLSDRDLSCESLKDEFKQAEKAKKDAEDVKGVTGTNTLAALFLAPRHHCYL